MCEQIFREKTRSQRANRLNLLLLWAEADAEFRSELHSDFLEFQSYANSEAERLIREACE